MLNRTRIVAEMACSHEGDPALARRIIDAAGAATADIVQFQMWVLSDMVVAHHPDYAKLRCLQLTPSTWQDLATYARDRHPAMQIFACVYEAASVDLAESIGVDGYKIHSSDLSNPWLLRRVAETRRPVHLSVGSSTIEEIERGIGLVTTQQCPIVLMYGFQNFPTPVSAVNLAFVAKLRTLFECPVGYQDHCDADSAEAFWIPAAAVGAGVEVLEKHLTHDRQLKGVDHESALNPDEFATFVRMVRSIDEAHGHATPRPFSEAEITYRKYSKKSLVAARSLDAGHVLALEDLRPMRADVLGLPPADVTLLLSRRLRRPIAAQHVVLPADVE